MTATQSLIRPDPDYSDLLTALERLVSQDLLQNKSSQILRDLQDYCLNDLYFLCKYILGYWWLCAGDYGPHRDFCHEIQKDIHLSLYLLPRGSCKTLIFSCGDTIRHAIKEPGLQIGLGSDTGKRASKRLREIKSHYKSNKVFRHIFWDKVWKNPERRSENPLWTNDEIHLPGFTHGQVAAVTSFGIESMPTGSHFPRTKLDDMVVPENSANAEQIQKVKNEYGLVRSSILTTFGNNQLCGTIYDDNDLHRELEQSGDYRTYKRPAEWYEDAPSGERRRRTLWPVQYGPKALDEIKRDPTVTVYMYSCQYLLDPAPDDENAFFRIGWFPRYKKIPPGLNYFAAADLAISKKKTAADTALGVGGLDHNFELYIVHVRFGHWDAEKIVENLLDMQALWMPGIFSLEAENIQKTIMPYLKLKERETGIFGNWEAVLPQGDKIAKARPLQGRAKEQAIWLPERGPKQPEWLSDTELSLRRFPRGKKKVIVDMLALLCQQLAKQWRPATLQERAEAEKEEYQPLDGRVGV